MPLKDIFHIQLGLFLLRFHLACKHVKWGCCLLASIITSTLLDTTDFAKQQEEFEKGTPCDTSDIVIWYSRPLVLIYETQYFIPVYTLHYIYIHRYY